MTSTSSSDDFLPLHLKIYEKFHKEWGGKTQFQLHFTKKVNGIVECKTNKECDEWYEPIEIKTLGNIKARLYRYYDFIWNFEFETIKIKLSNRENKLIDEILWVFETNDFEKDDDEYKDEINRELDKMAEFIYNTLF